MVAKKYKDFIRDIVFNTPRADRQFPLLGQDPDIDKKLLYDASGNKHSRILEKIRQILLGRINKKTEVAS